MSHKPPARPLCIFCHRHVPSIISIRVAAIGICHECARAILEDLSLITAKGGCWFCTVFQREERSRLSKKSVPLANLQGESHWGICFSCAWKAYKALYAWMMDTSAHRELSMQYAMETNKIKAGTRTRVGTPPEQRREAMAEGRKKRTRSKKEDVPSQTHPNFQELPVGRIRGNRWNPRTSGFDGQAFDELVASIRDKGVLQPILVRSIQDEAHDFEILAGERRHRAMCIVASEDSARSAIPAIIRECGDDEAFEICFIENLQRQDLSEAEEAHAFAEYVDQKGAESLVTLAERLGVSPRYVRRRVEIMRLPKPLIWAWQKEILQYGHLEQFLRIEVKKDRLMLLKQIIGAWAEDEGIPTVRDLKGLIDDASAELSRALFDKQACGMCARNSEIQKNLFGIEDDRARCLDSRCYHAKQKEWLIENWRTHLKGLEPELNTNGIRFSDEVSHTDCEPFYYRNTAEKCLSCENYVTVLSPSGSIHRNRACCGNKDCRNEVLCARSSTTNSPAQSPSTGDKPLPGGDGTGDGNGTPAKAWHGEYFRELFFKDRIPEKAKEYDPFHEKMIQLSLFAIIASNSYIHRWFAERLDLPKKPKDTDYSFFLLCRDIFPAIEALDPGPAVDLLKEAAIEVLLSNRTVMPATRRRAAEFLGIDLAAEWRITREYLEKKTKAEIVSIINRFDILNRPDVWKYASESCGLKLKSSIGSLKKDRMIGILLESGTDLAGIVPAEILHEASDGTAPAISPISEVDSCDPSREPGSIHWPEEEIAI